LEEAENFLQSRMRRSWHWCDPVSYSTGKGGCFHWGKAAGAWIWLLSQSTKEQLYLYIFH